MWSSWLDRHTRSICAPRVRSRTLAARLLAQMGRTSTWNPRIDCAPLVHHGPLAYAPILATVRFTSGSAGFAAALLRLFVTLTCTCAIGVTHGTMVRGMEPRWNYPPLNVWVVRHALPLLLAMTFKLTATGQRRTASNCSTVPGVNRNRLGMSPIMKIVGHLIWYSIQAEPTIWADGSPLINACPDDALVPTFLLLHSPTLALVFLLSLSGRWKNPSYPLEFTAQTSSHLTLGRWWLNAWI